MGECPAIPSNLNEEGQDFIKHCLEHDPKLRWTASKLLEHSFVKVSWTLKLWIGTLARYLCVYFLVSNA